MNSRQRLSEELRISSLSLKRSSYLPGGGKRGLLLQESFLLQESGNFLLLESGGKIII